VITENEEREGVSLSSLRFTKGLSQSEKRARFTKGLSLREKRAREATLLRGENRVSVTLFVFKRKSMPIRSLNPQGDKEWEKDLSSFHSLRQFLVSGLLFVLLVGVSLVNAPAADAGSRRERDPRASNGIAQFAPRT